MKTPEQIKALLDELGPHAASAVIILDAVEESFKPSPNAVPRIPAPADIDGYLRRVEQQLTEMRKEAKRDADFAETLLSESQDDHYVRHVPTEPKEDDTRPEDKPHNNPPTD